MVSDQGVKKMVLKTLKFIHYIFSEDWNIISESGNYDHWKYSVQYTEHLSHIPIIKNTAHGHFAVKPEDKGFSINSEHRTCFFSSVGCGKFFSFLKQKFRVVF